MLQKIALIVLAYLCAYTPAICQDKYKADFLLQILKKGNASDSLNTLYELGWIYFDVDNVKSLYYADAAYNSALRKGDSVMIVRSGRIKGQMLRRLDDLSKAIDVLKTIKPIAKRHELQEEYERILNCLALCYTFLGKHDEALRLNFECLDYVKKRNDKVAISYSANNIGLVYYNLKNFNKAIQYFSKSIRLKQEANSTVDLAMTYMNLALACTGKGNFILAKKYAKHARTIGKNDRLDQVLLDYDLCMGDISFERNNIDEAEKHFLACYNRAKNIDNKRYELEGIIALSRVYLSRGDLRQAKRYLEEGEKISASTSYGTLQIDLNKQFAELYTRLIDYPKAAKYQGEYIHLRDSIYGEELTQNLMVVQAEYEEHENQEKIEAQNKMLALKEQSITRQYWLTALVGVVIILLGALAVLLNKGVQRKKRVNALLEQKVRERSEQLAANYNLMRKAFEEQRRYITKASGEMKAPLETLQALCEEAAHEVKSETAQQYLDQLNKTTGNLTKAVERLSGGVKKGGSDL